ncbi:MAG TPA: hypothetical protein VGS97_01155 [Actinocrinis sp.]|uniref:hypothetical protein n=1 Tax=Actinocrinis sp. TaxID=1920516 RepID=UPI002DDD195F|nr:hypothetical protein [Actinocrinis sp.]HEV2342674.1 hypothetical protein [Actinocrinis sp.]
MSTGDDLRRRIGDLLKQHGRAVAAEAGGRLGETPGPLYRPVVVNMLLSIRIRASIAAAAARERFAAGWRLPFRAAVLTHGRPVVTGLIPLSTPNEAAYTDVR